MTPSLPQARSERSRGTLRDLLPALLMLLTGLGGLLIGNFIAETVPGQYVVIAPPGSSAQETLRMIAGAGGAMIGAGGFENIVFAASDNDSFAEAAEAAGAWAVFPAPTFLGCTPGPQES